MMNQETMLRIGKINYTNAWPIFHHFRPEDINKGRAVIVEKVPAQLNNALAAGEIDVSAISSFAYGLSFDDYLLLPDLSVSAFGNVNSIFLFYRKPFQDILNGNIALSTASATSVNLLKIIMEKFYGGKPTYTSVPPSLDEMMKNTDAALLIGDDAIRAKWANTEFEVMDLGEQWKKFTGEWMTFAVWAIRKQTAEHYPELIEEVFQAFQKSKRLGRSNADAIISAAQERVGGSYEHWDHYFSNLCYDFGAEQWRGLELYFQYLNELGLIDQKVPLQIWSNNKVVQVKQ